MSSGRASFAGSEASRSYVGSMLTAVSRLSVVRRFTAALPPQLRQVSTLCFHLASGLPVQVAMSYAVHRGQP